MAGQFRFRLPWLSIAAPAPRPVAEPRPPPPITEIEAPSRPTSIIPILRPPFRPAEMAPVQLPPPPAQSSPRTESQPALPPLATKRQAVSPSRATTQRRDASVPPSPFRATTEPQITQPALASLAATQARPALQTQSPSRTAPPSRAAASVPPSPSRTPSQPQAAAQTPSQHPGLTSFQLSSPAKLGARVPQPSPIEETKPKQEEEITSRTVRKYQTESASANVTTATMFEAGKRVEEKEGNRNTGEIKREGILSDEERKQQKDFANGKTMIGSNGEQMKTSRGRYAPSESHQKPTMSNGEKVPLHIEIRENISKFVNKLGTGLPKQAIGEKPASLLTLAGENKGAFLHLGTESARKDGSGYIHRGHKSNPDDTPESTSNEARTSKGRKPKYPATADEPLTKAYINSNTQGVNNSILFDSSVTEGSPGVQQNLSYNLAEPTKQSAKPGPLEAHKAEFNIALPEKHTYEPSVKRQCLGGLLIERLRSSDNPEKPLRHGCRYRSGEMIEDRDIVIL